ncbi:MAG: hypothetical protein MJE77_13410 [Proteobacteria bacterium]|nr:hypothetical protein [Pseudomonadota bacterium]
MSEDDLLSAATKPEWKGLSPITAGAITASAIVALIYVLSGPGGVYNWIVAVIVGIFMGGVLSALLLSSLFGLWLWLFDRDPYVKELLERAGWQNFDDRVVDAKTALDSLPEPAWLLVLRARALPHGGEHHVQIELPACADHPARISYWRMTWTEHHRHPQSDPRDWLRTVSSPLSARIKCQLLELLAGAERQPLRSKRATPISDGCPFDLVVFGRVLDQVLAAPGNLVTFELHGNLSVESVERTRHLVKLMLDTAQQFDATWGGYGSHDSSTGTLTPPE